MKSLKEIFKSLFNKNKQENDLPKEINGIPVESLSEKDKEILRAHHQRMKELRAQKERIDKMGKMIDEEIKKGLEISCKQTKMFQNLIDKNRK